MKLTKHKVVDTYGHHGWQVICDGRPTQIHIWKGVAPKYRCPQMYDVCLEPNCNYLFEAKGVRNAMFAVDAIARASLQSDNHTGERA